MSWGYKILGVYLAFVVGIATMVYKSSTQKIDLVTPDYYAKELKYQERIDAVKRTQALASKTKYEVINNQLLVTLPAEFSGRDVTGDILLYCPADNSRDIKKDFSSGNGSASITVPGAAKGAYQLQVSWTSEGNNYYFEENIFL